MTDAVTGDAIAPALLQAVAQAVEVDVDSIQAGGNLPFAPSANGYTFKSTRARKIHIEAIGGGGGGGGATKGGSAGNGGAAGEHMLVPIDLEETRYLLVVGAGGVGGACRRNHEGQSGANGGDSILSNARSGMRIVTSHGGAGGAHDAHPNPDRGGKGADLVGNGKVIAKGGAGGQWDADGAAGGSPGAGGGGHGGYDGPETDKGGNGGEGRVIVYFIN